MVNSNSQMSTSIYTRRMKVVETCFHALSGKHDLMYGRRNCSFEIIYWTFGIFGHKCLWVFPARIDVKSKQMYCLPLIAAMEMTTVLFYCSIGWLQVHKRRSFIPRFSTGEILTALPSFRSILSK